MTSKNRFVLIEHEEEKGVQLGFLIANHLLHSLTLLAIV